AHLQTIAFINIILSLYIPLFGLFQGANHSGFPTIVASVALGVRVLVTYLFRYSDFLGYSVIWWNGVFGFSMGFLVSWIYYFSGRWKKNVSLR
ncbi:MAG: multi antimicrobial extrusion protein MatE, partial [Lachnospiraceae bacterium]|nr:multi antimicrobial extrusion protein MatE [Lachnospiraceae bacterium]